MDNGTLFVDVVDMRSKTRNCILKKIDASKRWTAWSWSTTWLTEKQKEELYPVNLLITKRWTTWSSRSVGFQPKVRITFRLAILADITWQTQVLDTLYWRILNYYMFGNFPDCRWRHLGFHKIFIAFLLITIADFSHNRHNRRWYTFLAFLAFLSQIHSLFGVLFAGLCSSVVYQNWQISGMCTR